MKLRIEDGYDNMPKIVMKTSSRGGKFSIRFERDGDYNVHYKKHDFRNSAWGHLNLRQVRLLAEELERYIASEELNELRNNTVSKALSKLTRRYSLIRKLKKEISNA